SVASWPSCGPGAAIAIESSAGLERPRPRASSFLPAPAFELRMRRISSSVRALALLLNVGFASTLGAPLLGQGAGELLPDLIVDLEALRDWEVVENPFNGRAELRFSTSTPNIGAGPLVIRGVFPPNDDGTQNVVQRIFRAGGGFTERDAGAFVFHSDHDHIHLED